MLLGGGHPMVPAGSGGVGCCWLFCKKNEPYELLEGVSTALDGCCAGLCT